MSELLTERAGYAIAPYAHGRDMSVFKSVPQVNR
jgi:hypothetical protein